MFKKLLSNLPFNPSLIGQVTFYAKRLHAEEKLRRLGVILVVLSVLVQMFAVISPPEPTLAQSPYNDIINGGFSTREQAVLHCINPKSDFGAIVNHFGVTCTDIQNARTRTIKSTDHGGQLYSMGRIARGPIGRSNKPTQEYGVTIGQSTFYMRRLASLDTWAYSQYKVLEGKNSKGQTFMIMYDCGNLVWIGRFTPPPPPALPNGVCTVTSVPPSVRPGERFSATIRVQNTGGISWDPAQGYRLGSQSPTDNRNWGTNRVFLPQTVSGGSSLDVSGTFTAPTTPGTYQFAWQMLQEEVRWFGTSCSAPIIITAPAPELPPPTPETDLCPDLPGNQTDIDECMPCEESTGQDDIASCLELSKQASNQTRDIADANGTTAGASDVIKYTLSVKNASNQPVEDFVFEEELSDVLEYATITDTGGGTMNEDDKTLRWPAVTIAPGETAVKNFSVKIKAVIPQTPVSASDPSSFDLVMTNVFHDVTINIKLPAGVIKTTEQVTTTLPNTGPGTNIAVAVMITMVASYFFARSRLMAKEIDLVRSDYAMSGSF